MPEITYLIPVKVNKLDRYLIQAIQSIDRDTFKDKSILIVDNSAENVLENISAKDFGIKTKMKIVHCKNIGVANALNYGINYLDSKYVARLDHDDINCSNRTEIQRNYLEENSHIVGVGSGALRINDCGVVLGTFKLPSIKDIDEMRNTLRIENPYIHSSIMLRTDELIKYQYSEWAINCQDWDLWIRFAKSNKLIVNLKKNLISYRIHKNQISRNIKVSMNADALRRALINLDQEFNKTYLFQRAYLENKRPTYRDTLFILKNEIPKLRNTFATKKLLSSLLRSFF
jgi:glycosyltransferase involved in cell wall biosynthesis